MQCVFIVTDSETLSNFSRVRRLGYDVEVIPAIVGTKPKDIDKNAPDYNYLTAAQWNPWNTVHGASIRESWIRMLELYMNADDLVILCESDAVPAINAGGLEKIMKQELETHPDCDVWRLFNTLQQVNDTPPEIPGGTEVTFRYSIKHTDKDIADTTVWGTHAVIIPARSRAKIRDLFKETQLPVDIALEWAYGTGRIKLRSCAENLFMQQTHDYVWTHDPRFALCMSTFKRLKEAQRQIWCMMDQSYSNFHLFVALKGVSEEDFKSVLMPQFQHFVDEGRLTLRYAPNRNQVSNFLDCIRGCNISQYDFVAKIDDDDLYSRDYLARVASFHKRLPKNIGSYYKGFGGFLVPAGKYDHTVIRWYPAWGPTLIMPLHIIDTLYEVEQNPDMAARIGAGSKESHYGFAEDLLMHILNARSGAVNRHMFMRCFGAEKDVCICNTNDSTTRGGYLDDKFSEVTRDLNNDRKNNEYTIALADKCCEPKLAIVVFDKVVMTDTGDTYDVERWIPSRQLVMKDENGTTFTYYMSTGGAYIKHSEVPADDADKIVET